MTDKPYELCCECGNPTGRAGRGEDSLYIEDSGPYCVECYEHALEAYKEACGQFGAGA